LQLKKKKPYSNNISETTKNNSSPETPNRRTRGVAALANSVFRDARRVASTRGPLQFSASRRRRSLAVTFSCFPARRRSVRARARATLSDERSGYRELGRAAVGFPVDGGFFFRRKNQKEDAARVRRRRREPIYDGRRVGDARRDHAVHTRTSSNNLGEYETGGATTVRNALPVVVI